MNYAHVRRSLLLLVFLLEKELLDTIRDVHAGRKRIGQDVAAQLADHAGNSNKLIADRLSLSEDTVKRPCEEHPVETGRQRPHPRGDDGTEATRDGGGAEAES